MKERIKQHLPKPVLRLIISILGFAAKIKKFLVNGHYRKNTLLNVVCGESKKSFGDLNGDRTIYIIRREDTLSGLFALYNYTLAEVNYALEQGYVPVVDMKNYYHRLIQEKDKKGLENAWDYYFEQPGGITLEEAYRSKNVVLSSASCIKKFKEPKLSLLGSRSDEVRQWNRIALNNCRFKEDIRQEIEREYRRLLPQSERVLGVSIRMGYVLSYRSGCKKAIGHPVQPENVEEYIEEIEKYLKEWNCGRVFAAVDDAASVGLLKERLGGKIITLDRSRYRYQNMGKSTKRDDGNGFLDQEEVCVDVNNMGGRQAHEKKYIVEMALLSRCDCLLCGQTGGNLAAYILNGGRYEHVKSYDKGCYTK